VPTPNIPAGMRSLAALSLVLLLVVVGCSSGDGDSASTTAVRETVAETITEPVPSPTVLTVFMLRDGKVEPVSRDVVAGPEVLPVAALDQLLKGPTPEEAQSGLRTALPQDAERGGLELAGDTAMVNVTPEPPDRASRAQIVYTLTAFPNVKRVSFGGGPPVRRRAFEAQTPAILVESPLPGATVEPGFKVTGTANTFEATFNYELRNDQGRVLSKDFVTATSGSGTRGTFAFKVPYELDEPTDGTLVVFELSAEDGSRINELEIPLRLE
jgi:germination protein M